MAQGNWPVEPTTLYVFSYYPTNGTNELPTYTSTLLSDYNSALQAAKDYITSQSNLGVCIIQPITATIIFPFIPWEAF